MTSSTLSQNCNAAHKTTLKCAVPFSKNCDESLNALFYDTRFWWQTWHQKLSDLEIIDAIGGHYPNYKQATLLSPVIQTMKEASSFLNKLQKMEDGQTRHSSNRRPPISRPVCWRYRPRSEPRTPATRATQIPPAMIKTYSTVNTLQVENCRRLFYKGGCASSWIQILSRTVPKRLLTIHLTGMYSQKYIVRRTFASRCTGWSRSHRTPRQ